MLRVGLSLNREVFSKRFRLVGSPPQLPTTLTTFPGWIDVIPAGFLHEAGHLETSGTGLLLGSVVLVKSAVSHS